ncbi:glycoprotein [Streptomyces liangshanensis]|uniref:Glycoprotein n=1 Tax=Streptomyces liangshanensis TaxID=2717324 RepID=A0A6G9H7Q8_9ACTN|nr:glycoprotein [Streptomyces liangshanensis]QIQ06289.1 glycoprotein [Streptomyces liangshanensis]
MKGYEDPPIEVLLDGAEVLVDTYDTYDTGTALRRIAERAGDRAEGAPPPPGSDAPPAPGNRAAAHEQAARDLDLAVALVLNAPEAAGCLAQLVDHDRIDPQGAVVFAALLHLTGHRDAAQFWWQFAAGGGNRTAAFCLFLVHQRRAEFRDAAHWRAESRRLAAPGRTPADGASPSAAALSSLLPEAVLHDLIGQCHRGRHPTLPAALESVVNRLRVDSADEDYGEVPQPDATLVTWPVGGTGKGAGDGVDDGPGAGPARTR